MGMMIPDSYPERATAGEKRVFGLRNRDNDSFNAYESRAATTLLFGAGHFAETEKYDPILIDEGHDFEPDWLRCATNLLKRGPEGDLLVTVDGAQSLYGRARGFTWKSVGVEAKGRSRRLSRNYRNSKQILEFAWQAAQSVIQDVEETETHVRVLPTKASRQGPVPVSRGCITMAEEHALIARLVSEYRAKGLADRDIADAHDVGKGTGSMHSAGGSARRARSAGSRRRPTRAAGSGHWRDPGSG